MCNYESQQIQFDGSNYEAYLEFCLMHDAEIYSEVVSRGCQPNTVVFKINGRYLDVGDIARDEDGKLVIFKES